jgi:hypothetical protein
MKIDSVFTSILSSLTKNAICFEVTGISPDGREGRETYDNGSTSDLPRLLDHFHNLRSGSLWMTNVNPKNRKLGKRVLVYRKGEKYMSSEK